MVRYDPHLQFTSQPDEPDAVLAMEVQELIGGPFGEMTVMVQHASGVGRGDV